MLGRFRASSAQTGDTVKVRIQADSPAIQAIPEDQRDALNITEDTSASARRLARMAAQGNSGPERAFPLILVAVGIMSIPALYTAILEMRRQTIYHGVIVDARTTPVTVSHDPAIPAEMVLVIDASGKSTEYTSTEFNPHLLVCLLQKACKG
jgi:hypothetical protein